MPKRVTIMLDDDIDKKLRILQADKIKKSQKSVNFSHVINATLRKQLKL